MPRKTELSAGFTLIELLVVITIIVVLLALLTPALDRAIYQAELVVCASKLHSVGSGSQTYAMGNGRRYPYRVGVEGGTQWATAMIYNGDAKLTAAWNVESPTGATPGNTYDHRPMLRTFVNLNAVLNCGLSAEIDFENLDEDAHAYVSFNLFFGYKFAGYAGMKKLGDRLTYKDNNLPDEPIWRGDVLAGDRDSTFPTGGVQAAHPDRDGLTSNLVSQNGQFQNSHTLNLPFKITISTWFADQEAGRIRGRVDLNFVHTDG